MLLGCIDIINNCLYFVDVDAFINGWRCVHASIMPALPNAATFRASGWILRCLTYMMLKA
jgi:hypothetical protein